MDNHRWTHVTNSMKRNLTIKFFMRCTGHDFYGVRGEGRWGEVRFKKTQLLVVSRKHPISVSLASPSVWHSTIGRTKKHGICPKKLCGELVETIPSKAQKNGGLGKQIKGQ